MKKPLIFAVVLWGLGMVSWVRGTDLSFDEKKSREELQTMERHLGGIMILAEENLSIPEIQRTATSHSRYLPDQGAIFVIPFYGVCTERIHDPSATFNRDIHAFKLGAYYAIKIGLIKTLANYGDLLTTVESNEFINLILEIYNDNENAPPGVQRIEKKYEILSVQKSWIADYKTGKLSLEDFVQRVLEYSASGD